MSTAVVPPGTIAGQKPALPKARLRGFWVVQIPSKKGGPALTSNHYFTDFATEEADDYAEVEGESLWAYMQTRHRGLKD